MGDVVRGRLATGVGRGIELLDQHVPGWHRQLRVADLDIDDPWRCVLGQLFGSYLDGKEALDINGDGPRYGFAGADPDEDRLLTRMWTIVVRVRLNGS